MAIFTIAWPKGRSHDQAIRKHFTQFDVVGSLLLLAASVLVVFGLHEGGTGTYAWGSSVTVATLVIGGLCWISLFVWSFLLSSRLRWSNIAAIYPWELFSDRVMAAGIMSVHPLIHPFQIFHIANRNVDPPCSPDLLFLSSSSTYPCALRSSTHSPRPALELVCFPYFVRRPWARFWAEPHPARRTEPFTRLFLRPPSCCWALVCCRPFPQTPRCRAECMGLRRLLGLGLD